MTHGNVDTMQQSRRPYFLNGRCYSCRRLYIFDYHYSPVTCTSHTEALECQNETNKKMRSPSSSTLSRHARRQTQMKYKKTTEEYASQTEFMVTPFPLNGKRESSFTLNVAGRWLRCHCHLNRCKTAIANWQTAVKRNETNGED